MLPRLGIVVVLGVVQSLAARATTANPTALSHASMDVVNIISIVIPENPGEAINVQRLTDEFRQRLERIKKQSRLTASQSRIPGELTREERRKALELSRRVLYGRRGWSPVGSTNWTGEGRSRLEQWREGGQYGRARSPADPDVGDVVRGGYEENGGRKDGDRENRRVGDNQAFPDRREESPRREDMMSQWVSVRREDAERRDDGVFFVEDETGRMSRPIRDRSDQGWDVAEREEARIHRPGASGGDQRRGKLGRLPRQRDRADEIRGGPKYEKTARHEDVRVATPPEAKSAEGPRADQQRAMPNYSGPRSADGIGARPRGGRDFLGFDQPALVDHPREPDMESSIEPSCDESKRNRTGQGPGDPRPMSDPRTPSSAFRSSDHGASAKTLRGVRRESDNTQAPAHENTPSGDQHATVKSKKKRKKVKKKRGQVYFQNAQGAASMRDQEVAGVRTYDDHPPLHFPENPPNLYPPVGERFPSAEVPEDRQAPGAFQPIADNEQPITDSRSAFDYGSAGISMRIQRDVNVTATSASKIPKLYLDKNIIERLRGLLEMSPRSPMISYKRVVLVYGNVNGSRIEGDHGKVDEGYKSPEFTSAPSMAESLSWTNLELPHSPTNPSSNFNPRTL